MYLEWPNINVHSKRPSCRGHKDFAFHFLDECQYLVGVNAVSYTHLDVYKRQVSTFPYVEVLNHPY